MFLRERSWRTSAAAAAPMAAAAARPSRARARTVVVAGNKAITASAMVAATAFRGTRGSRTRPADPHPSRFLRDRGTVPRSLFYSARTVRVAGRDRPALLGTCGSRARAAIAASLSSGETAGAWRCGAGDIAQLQLRRDSRRVSMQDGRQGTPALHGRRESLRRTSQLTVPGQPLKCPKAVVPVRDG